MSDWQFPNIWYKGETAYIGEKSIDEILSVLAESESMSGAAAKLGLSVPLLYQAVTWKDVANENDHGYTASELHDIWDGHGSEDLPNL